MKQLTAISRSVRHSLEFTSKNRDITCLSGNSDLVEERAASRVFGVERVIETL